MFGIGYSLCHRGIPVNTRICGPCRPRVARMEIASRGAVAHQTPVAPRPCFVAIISFVQPSVIHRLLECRQLRHRPIKRDRKLRTLSGSSSIFLHRVAVQLATRRVRAIPHAHPHGAEQREQQSEQYRRAERERRHLRHVVVLDGEGELLGG